MPRSMEPGTIRVRPAAVCRWYAVLALALFLGLTQGAAGPALAQDKEVDLRLSLWVPPAHPLTSAAKAWGEDIAKASGGTIKITVFPSEQLGKAFDHYDMARDDIADITYVNPGYQPGPFPDHRDRTNAVHVRRRKKGHGGARFLVSEICGDRDEGYAFLLRLHS